MFAFCDGKRRKNFGYRSQGGVEYFGQSILREKPLENFQKIAKKVLTNPKQFDIICVVKNWGIAKR